MAPFFCLLPFSTIVGFYIENYNHPKNIYNNRSTITDCEISEFNLYVNFYMRVSVPN